MEFSVEQIATILSGVVEGDGELMVNTFGKIQDAGQGAEQPQERQQGDEENQAGRCKIESSKHEALSRNEK